MEIVSKKIVEIIKANSPEMDDSQLRIIKYGLECILSDASKFLAYIPVFWALSLLEYYLLSFICYCTIRAASGGYHASSYIKCFVISFTVFLAAVLAGKYLMVAPWQVLVILIFSLILTILFAPVDHPNKPLRNKMKQRRLKAASVIIVCIWGILSYVFGGQVSGTIVASILVAALMLPAGRWLNGIKTTSH